MPFSAQPTALPEVILLEPRVFSDDRGSFFESYNERDFEVATKVTRRFVQDNHSTSRHGVLRGLHYQLRRPQGKLIRVVHGKIFDVAVDLRRHSGQFGLWVGEILSSDNRRQLWIPEGFAHGFLVLSSTAEVLYKTTDYWSPDDERSLLWSDPAIGITWPLTGSPLLSAKDAAAGRLEGADVHCDDDR